MTPIDQKLDHALLTQETPLTLYRVTSRKYADSLSGIGGALSPGRWNRKGEEAIYTSTQIGVCVLERLVHTPKTRIPTDLALMTIHLTGIWQEVDAQSFMFKRNTLHSRTSVDWVYCPSLRNAADRYALREIDGNILVFSVPSVIVPVWNVVLYPRARGFWEHVSLVSVEPFDYDPRLFPEEAAVQL